MTGLPSCAKCGREGLLPGHFRIPYACRMVGRGLCGRCYHVELGADRLLDWPRPSWDAEELVAEAELVRATRRPAELDRELLYWREVAEVLGVAHRTLMKARERVAARARAAA